MDNRPTSDADHAYLIDRGFMFDPRFLHYVRERDSRRQYLTANPSRIWGTYHSVWSASALDAVVDRGTMVQLVVTHGEGFTEVIPCYVTAEVRLWQRQ